MSKIIIEPRVLKRMRESGELRVHWVDGFVHYIRRALTGTFSEQTQCGQYIRLTNDKDVDPTSAAVTCFACLAKGLP